MLKLMKYKVVFIVIFTLAFGMMMAPVVDAQDADTFGLAPIAGTAENPGIALGGDGTDEGLIETITQLINVALSLLGIIAVVVILIGGFKWMTAGGNDEQVGEARKWIFSGIIGLAIIMSAWAIANFVIEELGKATGADGYTL